MKNKIKKGGKSYHLTFKGLLTAILMDYPSKDQLVEVLYDGIELYLRRNYAEGGSPAIFLTENGLDFVTVKVKKSKN